MDSSSKWMATRAEQVLTAALTERSDERGKYLKQLEELEAELERAIEHEMHKCVQQGELIRSESARLEMLKVQVELEPNALCMPHDLVPAVQHLPRRVLGLATRAEVIWRQGQEVRAVMAQQEQQHSAAPNRQVGPDEVHQNTKVKLLGYLESNPSSI